MPGSLASAAPARRAMRPPFPARAPAAARRPRRARTAAPIPRPSGPPPLDVLASAYDPDNPSLTLQLDGQPPHGTLSVVGGKLRYAPVAGYSGPDYLPFKVTDGVKSSRSRVYATVKAAAGPGAEIPDAARVFTVGFSQSGATAKDTLAAALAAMPAGGGTRIILNDSATAYPMIARTLGVAAGTATGRNQVVAKTVQGARIAGIGGQGLGNAWDGAGLLFHGIDFADKPVALSGANVDFLRCLWDGWQGTGEGNPQVMTKGTLTRFGYCEARNCDNNWFNIDCASDKPELINARRPVLAYCWLHNFSPVVENGGEMFRIGTGNENRNVSMQSLVHMLLLENHTPSPPPGKKQTENESVGNKCRDNVYQYVRARNVKGVNNRMGGGTVWNGMWLSGGSRIQCRGDGIRYLGVKITDTGDISLMRGEVNTANWATYGNGTGGGRYVECADIHIRDSQLRALNVGGGGTELGNFKALRTKYQNCTGVSGSGSGIGNDPTEVASGLIPGVTTLTCPDLVGNGTAPATGVGIGSPWRGWPTRSYS